MLVVDGVVEVEVLEGVVLVLELVVEGVVDVELVKVLVLVLVEEGVVDVPTKYCVFDRILIYFENDVKEQVLSRIANTLKPNGILFIGHSESLHGVSNKFLPIKPAIYRLA